MTGINEISAGMSALAVVATGVWQIVRMGTFVTRMDTLISQLAKRVKKLEKHARKGPGKRKL